MAPRTMESKSFTVQDLQFMKVVANNPDNQQDCNCRKLQELHPAKQPNARPTYGRSISLFDLRTKKKDAGDSDKLKRVTLSSTTAKEVLTEGKAEEKSRYSRLVQCWRKLKKTLRHHSAGKRNRAKEAIILHRNG
ncbi:hypothetical protein NQ315_007840 [Exocentrus adspersus]|uniref:Uncharacterized protein n=1 Tax=Exocentrus adspersus TaxID=1586481 RepID=A0AAV8W9T4_9CUCU|nr:hypothetical protein NQ315_007840 [Exocentrus adspersus]